MKNKLTLKSLQQELEQLKNAKSKGKVVTAPTGESHKSSVAHDIKNSYIQNLHMKSSMLYLWLITGILGYARKIPIISKFISFAYNLYGRTTFFRILIKVRKLFVVFNAIIGFIMVYKTTGFGVDTFWANFIALGTNYLDIFITFNKRLFNWIFELFDYKVVPNIPSNKPSSAGAGNVGTGKWFPRGIDYA
jgi:small basic protein